MKKYDVIVIGGGITGAGTARDCAMRGLSTLLVERGDIAAGATGRNHGLLHSGARYAVNDGESAAECIRENLILKRIARNCIEETDGLFITLPEDDIEYQQKFIIACAKAGIRAERIEPDEARHLEPSVNPDLKGAVRVPDGSVDPFRLAAANVMDARLHGAEVMTYHEVTGFIKDQRGVCGVNLRDNLTGEVLSAEAPVVINASGIWGERVAAMAGVKISMFPAKGALLVFGHRVNNMVINRCRKSSDADILVPGDTVSIIGTTSTRIPQEEVDGVKPTAEEVSLLLREGSKLAPQLATTRVLRAYAGVRPLVASDDDPTGRNISRGIVLLDHQKRDGLEGFITITGGKLMTYRLMSEKAADLACAKLGSNRPCQTSVMPLPGSEIECEVPSGADIYKKSAVGRQGTRSAEIGFGINDEPVCECENVSEAEIRYAVEKLGVRTLTELRIRTRLGMGTCQGSHCIAKAAKILARLTGRPEDEEKLVEEYVAERWKGMAPVAWGETLREMEYMRKTYVK
jgi:glycerol-3-phosphate dehydrogenase, anaerobic, A subunit